MVVPDARVDKAMAFLAQTDLEVAEWKGMVLRTEFMAKAAEALVYKALEGSVEDRKQGTRLDENVKKAWEEHFKAVVQHETLKARREREILVIELWRSVNANRRAANIT